MKNYVPKASSRYVGLLVSGFSLLAGLLFTRWPVSLPALTGEIADVVNEAVSEREQTAQTCKCHPNKVPEKVEKLNGNIGMLPGEPLQEYEWDWRSPGPSEELDGEGAHPIENPYD